MLKQILTLFLLFVASSQSLFQNQFQIIGKINLTAEPINNVTIYYPTEFILKNKKSVAKVYSMDLIELISKKIKNIELIETRRSGLIIKDKFQNTTIVSFSEILQDVSIIPPMIIFNKVKGSVGDTVKIQDFGLGDLDFAAIDAELSQATKKRVQLQMSYPPAKVDYFSTISVVFPTDKSYNRWICDVQEIILFEFN